MLHLGDDYYVTIETIIKNPHCSMAMSVELRSKFAALHSSQNDWKFSTTNKQIKFF